MSTERDRVISVTLTEAEWRAFVARHPRPVDWLRERIREDLELQEGGMADGQDSVLFCHPAVLQS